MASSNIANAITNAQSRVKSIYTKCETLRATIPTTKNISNLPNAIDSIIKIPYKRISYIRSTGTQAIQTGVPVSSHNIKLKIDMQVLNLNSDALGVSGGPGGMYLFRGLSGGNTWDFIYGQYQSAGGVSTVHMANIMNTNRHTFLFDGMNKSVSISEILSAKSITPNYTAFDNGGIALCARWDASTNEFRNFGRVMIYECEMWNGVDMLRHFIPVILIRNISATQDSQNVARSKGTVGLWDLVTLKFYANAGTGTFLYA